MADLIDYDHPYHPGYENQYYSQEPERFTRVSDFETETIEQLTAQLDALQFQVAQTEILEKSIRQLIDDVLQLKAQLDNARAEYRVVYARCPFFVQEWLDELGRVLGVE
jgi:hypothetical protein